MLSNIPFCPTPRAARNCRTEKAQSSLKNLAITSSSALKNGKRVLPNISRLAKRRFFSSWLTTLATVMKSGNISKRFVPNCKARCWSFTRKTTAKFPRRRPVRRRKNCGFCASNPTRLIVEVALQGHRFGPHAQGRLGRAERHHHCWSAGIRVAIGYFARTNPWARLAPDVFRHGYAGNSFGDGHPCIYGFCRVDPE